MATPQTADDLLQLIRKSGLIEEETLNEFISAHQHDGLLKNDPKMVVATLIQEGIITSFQGEQFLLGKWKGFTLGKYRLLERIGVGGMGQVFLCEHTYMRRRVAIKVLPPTKAQDPVSLARFYREARVASALDHPNIVKTYDIDQDANLHFLVMEYVDGTSLLDIVKRFGPLNVLRACHYIRQACQGLQYAHSTGMIHRDIKPGNIMVDRQGTAKLLDMGLARFYHDEKDQLTLKYDDKNVLGTADYVSPEQTRDSRNVDIRADIYGMGATFYYILTGQPPFPEPTVAEKLIAHQTKKPRPIREIRPEVPVGVAKIIEKMMAKDPKDRFQTPQDVVDALEIWTQQPIDPPPAEEMPKLSPAAMKPGFGTAMPALKLPVPQARSDGNAGGLSRAGFRTSPLSPATLLERPAGGPPPGPVPYPNPTTSMVDLVLPRDLAGRPPMGTSAETHPMPTAPDPTPQPKPPPVSPPSATVPGVSRPAAGSPSVGHAGPPTPASRIGSLLPRFGDAAKSTSKPPVPPPSSSIDDVTVPLPPQQLPMFQPPTSGVPAAPIPPAGPPSLPSMPPAASTDKAADPAPPPKPSKPAIELPKLRSFQGATVPLLNLSAGQPPAGVLPASPPMSKAPPVEPPLAPSKLGTGRPPSDAPRLPASQIPKAASSAAPSPPPPLLAPPPLVPPATTSAPTRLSSIPVGKPTTAPAYKPPTMIPFFDQPIVPPEPSLFSRLARWFFLVLVSSAIGAGLGVAIWYHFFRLPA
jgi:serine/threonine protein kinase